MPEPIVILPPISPGLERLDILRFCRDPRLLDFQPWPAQEAILRALYALPMPPELVPLWHQLTESPRPYVPRYYSDVYLILGRQSGKNCISTAVAAYEGICRNYATLLPGQRYAQCTVVATRLEQVRDEFISRLALDLEASDVLRDRVVRYDNKPDPGRRTSNKDQVVFANRSLIRGMPCSARAVRGPSSFLSIFDEACHYSRETGSIRGDLEVYRAVRPSMRIFKQRGLARELTITTPQAKEGQVFEAYDQREDRREWQLTMRAASWVMDPGWSWEHMRSEQAKDPLGFQIEYGAEFCEQILAAFTREEVERALDRERPASLPPESGRLYEGALDPAFTRERFAFGVSHRQGQYLVADHLEALAPAQGRAVQKREALERIRALHWRYGVRRWQVDQYAGEPIAQDLRGMGVPCEVTPWGAGHKRTIYSALVAALKVGDLRAPWSALLERELLRLQRREGPAGASFGHPAAAGETDDLVSILAVLAQACASQPAAPRRQWSVEPMR